MCYHPWVGLDISPQGEFRPCCKYQNSIADNLNTYINSNELSQLKDQFLLGLQPLGCKRCWDDELARLPSKRQLDWEYIFKKSKPATDSFKILSLAFGNSCNLACRTCDSSASSGWIVESKKLQLPIFKHQRFYQDQEFINSIKQKCNDVVHVEFPGGEPFIAGLTEHLEFLDYLITQDPKNTSLHYMTNATVFPNEQFWIRWEQFKKVDIQLSIDGTNQQFEYIRYPGVWSEVIENIKKYNKQKTEIVQMSISHTVSIFNIYYLPEFVKWCLQNQFGKPYFGLVSDPDYFNVKVLPQSVKNKLTDRLTKFGLQGIIKYMNSEDLSHLFANTREQIDKVDSLRNQSFKQVFPEFFKLIEE
jgi:MoaA/NifB/PqqE/SkfB family radical SAM enzyme